MDRWVGKSSGRSGAFADFGPQYRPIILYHSAEQKADAERAIAEVREEEI